MQNKEVSLFKAHAKNIHIYWSLNVENIFINVEMVIFFFVWRLKLSLMDSFLISRVKYIDKIKEI